MKEAGSFVSLDTNKTLKMPYNDLQGWVIETSGTLKGELFAELVDVSANCAIKDFSMKFQLKDNYVSTDNSIRFFLYKAQQKTDSIIRMKKILFPLVLRLRLHLF